MNRRKHNILKTFVLGVAVAAVAAPTALGEPRGPGNPTIAPASSSSQSPDDRPLYRGVSRIEQQVSSDDRSFYRGTELRPVAVSLSPDDRPLWRGAPTEFTPVSASPDDRPFSRSVPPEAGPVSLTISDSDDFQWGDAGLGAGLALTLIMLMGGGALLIRHQRQRIAAY